jgi:hypothetical protein
MAHLKKTVIDVKAETDCLAQALIIAIVKVTNNPDYKVYIQGRKIRPVVQNVFAATGIDMVKGTVIPGLERFRTNFRKYRFVAYARLHCDSIMFEGEVELSHIIQPTL